MSRRSRLQGGVLRVAMAGLAATVGLGPLSVAAQDGSGQEPLRIPRVEEPIELDGQVADAAWDNALRLDPVMHLPDFGAEPTEPTEFLVAHDGEYLYFGCRAYDSDPDGIQAVSLQRNNADEVNDWCVLVLDTYMDQETGILFGTTPAGLRTEGVFPNDAEDPPNFDWNTFWDAEARTSDDGWTAELRIPFSSLGFQVEDGRVTMGLIAWRHIPRKNERITHPAISPEWGGLATSKASLARPVELQDVDEGRALRVTPYALGGTGHSHTLDGEDGGFVRDEERVGDLGLDLQYGLGPNFTLDVTVNTDFAQVEADDEQVNLDRFDLFFPEKRRFFQERGDVFEFRLRGVERLFHSRRVGLGEDGEPVRVYGGARVVGRMGEWDLGALSMQTGESEALPSENQSVVRARRGILNEASYVGGILTSRLGTDGSRNVVYGADSRLRVLDRDYLTVTWAQSFDDQVAEDHPGSAGFLDRALMRMNWERRGDDGLGYEVDLSRAGAAFEPGMGFLFRRDYTRADAGVGYGWRPGSDSRLLHYSVDLDGSVFRLNEDGSIETATVGPSVSVETRGGHRWSGSVEHRHEELAESFGVSSEVTIPAGRYRFSEGSIRYRPSSGETFRPGVTLEGGEYFDGRRISLAFNPFWAPSRHLELRGTYRLDRIEVPDRGESMTAYVGRLRGLIMFSTSVSVSTLLQYNSAGDRGISNFRFRYNPREGNDLYVVWNEGINTNRRATEPVPPRSAERSLLVKYSHTFSLGL